MNDETWVTCPLSSGESFLGRRPEHTRTATADLAIPVAILSFRRLGFGCLSADGRMPLRPKPGPSVSEEAGVDTQEAGEPSGGRVEELAVLLVDGDAAPVALLTSQRRETKLSGNFI